MPKNLTFTNNLSRIYNERQVRNNLVPNYEFAPIFLKKFNWDRTYDIGYDLTKNIKASFSATNRAIFEEGNHRVDRRVDPEGFNEFRDSVRSQMSTSAELRMSVSWLEGLGAQICGSCARGVTCCV